MINKHYVEWSKAKENDLPQHGIYNGGNLLGIDPVKFFQFLQINPDLGIVDFIQREQVAFRVLAPFKKNFSWLEQYPFMSSKTVPETPYVYELAMTYYGLPIEIIPKSKTEITATQQKAIAKGIYPLTYANTTELTSHPCCQLVDSKNSNRWSLSKKGYNWMAQLLYSP